MDLRWVRDTKKRLGVTSKTDPRDEFRSFRVRVLNVIAPNLNLFRQEGIALFYQLISEPVRYLERPTLGLNPGVIVEKLAGEGDERQFLFLLQAVLELPLYGYGELLGYYHDPRAVLLGGLLEAFRLSDVDVELLRRALNV